MRFDDELKSLIDAARTAGAIVRVSYDQRAQAIEGREIIAEIQVAGLKGCGPHPMSPLSAAERLRESLFALG